MKFLATYLVFAASMHAAKSDLFFKVTLPAAAQDALNGPPSNFMNLDAAKPIELTTSVNDALGYHVRNDDNGLEGTLTVSGGVWSINFRYRNLTSGQAQHDIVWSKSITLHDLKRTDQVSGHTGDGPGRYEYTGEINDAEFNVNLDTMSG